jgi:hypothetical protein
MTSWSIRYGLNYVRGLFFCYTKLAILNSVAKGPKFRPQSTKRAEKKLSGPGKSGAELLHVLSKKSRKGAELFSSLVFHKIIYISCSTDYACKLVYISFLTTLDLEPLKKTSKVAIFSQCYVGAELFRQRPNFLIDLAENS